MKLNGIYIPIRGDYTRFQADMAKARSIAREQGKAISDALGNAIGTDSATRGLSNLTRNLAQAQRALSGASFKGTIDGLDELARIAGVSASRMQELSSSLLRTASTSAAERAFTQIQKATGASNLEMARLRASLGDTSGALKSVGAAALGAAPMVLGVGTAAVLVGRATLESVLELDKLTKAFKTIEGSASGAEAQLRFIRDTSSTLGMQFQSSAAAAKTFFAAGKGTALERDLNRIFLSVSEAGTALALSQEEMQGVFLALGQMLSKGKVQAEELRGQLGERLPGAFRLAAQAMGVTTGELDKMLEQGQVLAEDLLPKLATVLHNEFGNAAVEAAQGAQAAINRLSSEWGLFKANMVDVDPVIKAINAVTEALKDLQAGAQLRSVWDTYAQGMSLVGRGQIDAQAFTKASFRERQDMVDAIINPKHVDDPEVKARRLPLRAEAAYERVQAQYRTELASFLKDSDATKIDKLNASYKSLVENIDAARDAALRRGQASKPYDDALTAAAQQYTTELDKIGKKEKDRTNELYRSANAAREVQEALAMLAGDEVTLARLKFDEQFARWTKELKGVTPQLRQLRDEAERAFTLGMTPQQLHGAQQRWKEQTTERSAELGVYRANAGSQRLDSIEQERLRGLAEIERWKQSDSYRSASPTEQATAAAEALELVHLKAQQRIEEINVAFLGKAASTFRNRVDLQRKALEEEYQAYAKHVRDKTLLDAWYAEEQRKISRDATDGMAVAYAAFTDDATNMAKNFGDAFTQAMEGTATALERFAETGKLSFRGMVDAMVADLTRIAARRVTSDMFGRILGMAGSIGGNVGGPLTQLFAGLTGQAYDPALQSIVSKVPLHHEGGMAGASSTLRTVPLAMFANAPRYHRGGFIGPDEIPAILQTGERVQSRAEVAAMAKVEGRLTGMLERLTTAKSSAISMHITTPDAGSFRKSRSQITAELAVALERARR